MTTPEPPDGATVKDRDGHTWRRDDKAVAIGWNQFRWTCPVKGRCGTWEHVLTQIEPAVNLTPTEDEGAWDPDEDHPR